jgi:hypothetical protein
MTKVKTSPEVTIRAITVDGRLVGSIASFVIEGDTEVTYWIDRSFSGQGIAGRALALPCNRFRCGRYSPASRVTMWDRSKVLQKAGFAIADTEVSFANGRSSRKRSCALTSPRIPHIRCAEQAEADLLISATYLLVARPLPGQAWSRFPVESLSFRLLTAGWCGSHLACASPVTAARRGYRGVCPARSSGALRPTSVLDRVRAWLRVICACWHTNTPYNPTEHRAAHTFTTTT